MKKEKKKWETPKLMCLYRGRPEEAVLTGCKSSVAMGSNVHTGTCESGGVTCKNVGTS